MRSSLVIGVSLLIGCANGTEVEGDGGEGGEYFTGAGGYGGTSTIASTSSAVTASSGGTGGGGGVGGSSNDCDFSTTASCQSAQVLSQVSGDNGGSVGATGTTSAWFHVKIAETNSSIFEVDLSYTVTLKSPPGTLYDLVVYQGPQDGGVDCNATPKLGQPPGATQSVSDAWDDDQGFGGEDDSVWLAIEVVYVSGNDCITPWILTVEGGT